MQLEEKVDVAQPLLLLFRRFTTVESPPPNSSAAPSRHLAVSAPPLRPTIAAVVNQPPLLQQPQNQPDSLRTDTAAPNNSEQPRTNLNHPDSTRKISSHNQIMFFCVFNHSGCSIDCLIEFMCGSDVRRTRC